MKTINLDIQGLFAAADSYGKGTATWEIIIMLLGAFVLGYLLRMLIKRNSKADCSEWENKYNNLKMDYDNHMKTHSTPMAAAAPVSSPPKNPDDLTKIEGVGPKIQELLIAAGLYTWKQVSEVDPSVIKKILDEAGPRFRVHNPSTWPNQAKLAHEGKWDELDKLQDELKGGK